MLPATVDPVSKAAYVLGYQFKEQVFYRAALEAGFGTRAEDKAHELHDAWVRSGYAVVPSYVKHFIDGVLSRKQGA